MTSKDPQKNIATIMKSMKLSGFFSDFRGLNYFPTNFLRQLINSQFSLALTFILVTTSRGLKTLENRPKLFVLVFLIENSCLNCFKVDRIQDYKKN